MKISYNWLKEFVDVTDDAQTLGRRITHVGLALESCEDANGDSVLDLDVTTNRPDCLSHLGVAREVSAIYGGRAPETAVQAEGRQPGGPRKPSPYPSTTRNFAAGIAADILRE